MTTYQTFVLSHVTSDTSYRKATRPKWRFDFESSLKTSGYSLPAHSNRYSYTTKIMFSLMANCFSWIKWKREPIKKIAILMIGLDNAGKTTTVADLNGDSREGITPTLGFLMSSFNMQRFNVTIFDLGGGSRIRGIWKNYYADIYGIVYVVDASDRDKIEECRTILHETKQNSRISGKPLLILANKQDIQGAMSEEEIYQHLDLGSIIAKHKCPCQVFTCSAYLAQGNKIDKQIKKGFRWLLTEVSNNFSTISQRVERDSAEQKRQDAVERKAKLERVRKIREERKKEEEEAAERAKRLADDSDDDVIVGSKKEKTSRKGTPTSETSTPEKKKKKKRKKKVKETSLGAVDEDEDQPDKVSEVVDNRHMEMNDLQRRLQPLEDRGMDRLGRLDPIESPEHNDADDGEAKKKKKKKKKRKTNKTAPMEDEGGQELPPLSAWGTPPGTLNGGVPGGSTGGRRLEPLGTPNFSGSAFGGPSIQDSDEEPRHLGPISNKPWNRFRPNSEDHDVIT